MDSDSCDLSPQARAFSTVLTAFIGSIVNGVTSGGMVAFMTGWISWLAVLRVLSGALFGLYQAFSSKYTILEQASREPPADEEVPEERGVMLRHLSQEAVSKETSDAQETPGSSYPSRHLTIVKKLNGRIAETSQSSVGSVGCIPRCTVRLYRLSGSRQTGRTLRGH